MAAKPKLRPVLRAMERLYPLSLADKSWDNVGLLVASQPKATTSGENEKESCYLTIDLTKDVLDDVLASGRNVKTIIAYHPVIFRGLKAIQPDQPDGKGEVILRCIQEGIQIYSPHTAVVDQLLCI